MGNCSSSRSSIRKWNSTIIPGNLTKTQICPDRDITTLKEYNSLLNAMAIDNGLSELRYPDPPEEKTYHPDVAKAERRRKIGMAKLFGKGTKQ